MKFHKCVSVTNIALAFICSGQLGLERSEFVGCNLFGIISLVHDDITNLLGLLPRFRKYK